MRALIVFVLELLALLLLATGAAWAAWPFYPPGGLVAAAVVVASGAWLAERAGTSPKSDQ